MNPHQIARLFPHASKSVLAANQADYGPSEAQNSTNSAPQRPAKVPLLPKSTTGNAEPLLSVFLPCVPPKTTAQQKGAFATPAGGVRFFKKKKTKLAEALLRAVLLPHVPAQPFAGPLHLSLDFILPWRKSEKKSVIRQFSQFPSETAPDLSNRVKQLEDLMTDLGYWRNDGQIAVLHLSKWYGDTPGIAVAVWAVTGKQRHQPEKDNG